jgi:hypothetical protein
MGRTFSVATLLMATAIVAVSVASIRGLWLRVDEGASSDIMIPMEAGAAAGALFGFALAIWNRDESLWRPKAWPKTFASTMCGYGLGAAAGAQVTAPVGWFVVVLGPAVVIGSAALVTAIRRRQARRLARQASPVGPREAEAGPAPPEPCPTGEPLLADEPR